MHGLAQSANLYSAPALVRMGEKEGAERANIGPTLANIATPLSP